MPYGLLVAAELPGSSRCDAQLGKCANVNALARVLLWLISPNVRCLLHYSVEDPITYRVNLFNEVVYRFLRHTEKFDRLVRSLPLDGRRRNVWVQS